MLQLVIDNVEQIAAICRAHHVKRLAIFGSAARDDFDPERSDIDLLYEFEPSLTAGFARTYFSLARELEALFKRKVDLIAFGSVENPFLLKAINADQELLYAA